MHSSRTAFDTKIASACAPSQMRAASWTAAPRQDGAESDLNARHVGGMSFDVAEEPMDRPAVHLDDLAGTKSVGLLVNGHDRARSLRRRVGPGCLGHISW